jgi:hypothetical protein
MPQASPLERQIIIGIREILADECTIAPEKIDPDEKCVEFNNIMGPEGFWGYYFQPIKGFMGFDGKIFYFKLISCLLSLGIISDAIPLQNLSSLAYFARNKNFQLDDTMLLKNWVIELKNELLFHVTQGAVGLQFFPPPCKGNA